MKHLSKRTPADYPQRHYRILMPHEDTSGYDFLMRLHQASSGRLCAVYRIRLDVAV